MNSGSRSRQTTSRIWSIVHGKRSLPTRLSLATRYVVFAKKCEACLWPGFPRYLSDQRLAAAFLAISRLRSGVSFSRRAAPPFLPSAWAALSLPESPVSSSISPVRILATLIAAATCRRVVSGLAVPLARNRRRDFKVSHYRAAGTGSPARHSVSAAIASTTRPLAVLSDMPIRRAICPHGHSSQIPISRNRSQKRGFLREVGRHATPQHLRAGLCRAFQNGLLCGDDVAHPKAQEYLGVRDPKYIVVRFGRAHYEKY